MKYIKLFEQHSSTLEDNINAALVELEDLGFKVMKTFYLNDDKPVGYENQKVDIRILKPDDSNRMTLFEYDDVDDIIMTLIDYLKEVWGFVSSEFSYSFRNPSKRSYGGLTTTKGVPRNKSILDLTLTIKEVIFPIKTSDVRAYEGMYYSDEIKKTIEDILVELRDEGFKYFFNDIREGLTITLEKGYHDTFKKSDIVEPFLMLEDYMKEEWGNDIRISYEYHSIGAGTGHVNVYGKTPRGMKEQPEFKVHTITDIKIGQDNLVKVKFMCCKTLP
jgi:hypothetical protein